MDTGRDSSDFIISAGMSSLPIYLCRADRGQIRWTFGITVEAHQFSVQDTEDWAKSMARPNSTAENAFKCTVNPARGYLGKGVGDSPKDFYIYSSGWFCLLQFGWEVVASRCTPQRCSLSSLGSFEYTQDKRGIGISCLPAFGCKFDKCRDRKSETDSEVFRAFRCQYHCQHLHAHDRRNGTWSYNCVGESNLWKFVPDCARFGNRAQEYNKLEHEYQ